MDSCAHKGEGEEGRKEKFQFGFHKLRNVFGSDFMTSDKHSNHHVSDHCNRHAPKTSYGAHSSYGPQTSYGAHTSYGRKQTLSKSHSYNPMSAGQDAFFTRNKPFLRFSSSVPNREEIRPISYNKSSMQTPTRHSTLAFSKSLPISDTKATLPAADKEMTQNKQKLSRSGQETFFRHEDKLRRKAQIWRNDLAMVKKRKEDINFNLERNFHFDDQLSLKSDESNPEDHIYEEIDNDIFTTTDDEEDEAEENFLLGISLERRNNLKFYGGAGWDFGNGS